MFGTVRYRWFMMFGDLKHQIYRTQGHGHCTIPYVGTHWNYSVRFNPQRIANKTYRHPFCGRGGPGNMCTFMYEFKMNPDHDPRTIKVNNYCTYEWSEGLSNLNVPHVSYRIPYLICIGPKKYPTDHHGAWIVLSARARRHVPRGTRLDRSCWAAASRRPRSITRHAARYPYPLMSVGRVP